MSFEQIFQLLVLMVAVIVYWWAHRSFPPQQTSELLERLSETSRHTETRLDDLLVEIARLLNEMRQDVPRSSDPEPPA